MAMTSSSDIRTLLSRRVKVGQSSVFVATYLERTSGRLHDSILNKICSAFLSGLEDKNRNSPCARCTESQKQEYARRLDDTEEYYDSIIKYDVTWQNDVHTAINEPLSAGYNGARNIKRHRPDCEVPEIPQQRPTTFSHYFLSFIILMVRTITTLLFMNTIQLFSNHSLLRSTLDQA